MRVSLILTLLIFAFIPELKANDAEKAYLEQRDKLYKEFYRESCDELQKDEEVALNNLEKMLQNTLAVNGKTTLSRLNKGCAGYADSPSFLDGLWFNQQNGNKVFVSTKNIIDDYLPKENSAVKDLSNLLFPNCLICYDAFSDRLNSGISVFSSLINQKDQVQFGAFLVAEGQDFNVVPSAIIAYKIKEEKLFVEFAKLPLKFEKISECKDEWSNITSGTIEAQNNLYLQYGNCFVSKVKNKKFYLDSVTKAQEIIDHL